MKRDASKKNGRKPRNVYMTDSEFRSYRQWISAYREGEHVPGVGKLSPDETDAVKGFLAVIRGKDPWLLETWRKAAFMYMPAPV